MANIIPTSRLEAFSDGVIAIIITIMVFDLKMSSPLSAENIWAEVLNLLPKFLSYMLSFIAVAIMWVNHHQLFHLVSRTDGKLLWINMHLLFWMSLIPLATNTLGASPFLPQSNAFYGFVFFMNASGFAWLRQYAAKHLMPHEPLQRKERAKRKGYMGMLIYCLAILLSFVSVYFSFLLFIIVPAMYFMPDSFAHETND
jgi:uncharacterized membrane protein